MSATAIATSAMTVHTVKMLKASSREAMHLLGVDRLVHHRGARKPDHGRLGFYSRADGGNETSQTLLVWPWVASSVDRPGRDSEGGGVADENCSLLRESATKGWGAPVDGLAWSVLCEVPFDPRRECRPFSGRAAVPVDLRDLSFGGSGGHLPEAKDSGSPTTGEGTQSICEGWRDRRDQRNADGPKLQGLSKQWDGQTDGELHGRGVPDRLCAKSAVIFYKKTICVPGPLGVKRFGTGSACNLTHADGGNETRDGKRPATVSRARHHGMTHTATTAMGKRAANELQEPAVQGTSNRRGTGVPIAVPEKFHATKRSSSGPENTGDFDFDEDEDIYDWWGADADPMNYGSGDVPEEVYSPDPSLASSSSKLANPRLIHVEGSEFADYERCFCGRGVAVFHAGRKAPKKYRCVRSRDARTVHAIIENGCGKRTLLRKLSLRARKGEQMITKEEGQNVESV
ncbi:hypothetical protein B0H14DRAFT_2614292 [Mycena olivaceomarginata]|nr:hypothetical protein B0H14DRAFT_2614292 [Mycena olivaceomarginata]